MADLLTGEDRRRVELFAHRYSRVRADDPARTAFQDALLGILAAVREEERERRIADHWLYHALVGRLERALSMEPCEAIKLANELSDGLADDAAKAEEMMREH